MAATCPANLIGGDDMKSQYPPRALAVAASDSSGAAGLQADLKTFAARGVFGFSALTAITAQDSKAIHHVQALPAALVANQMLSVLADFEPWAIKTGLLFQAEIILAVAEVLGGLAQRPLLVVDPVLVAGNGRQIVSDDALAAYCHSLFPKATVITPNALEATLLSGVEIRDETTMQQAAIKLHAMGPTHVLIKGAHTSGGEATSDILDILYDGKGFHAFRTARLPLENPRGAGCTFAACLTAELAKGASMVDAAGAAVAYVGVAIKGALNWQLGHGRPALNHTPD
jgi:hydroxymethylpyrimidine/phosphomethylpyrimidine kinase